MNSLVHQLLIGGGALGAVAVFVRRWPPVKRWGPILGMALATGAYFAAETSGQEKWALSVVAVNAVLVVYVVMRRLVPSRSSNGDR